MASVDTLIDHLGEANPRMHLAESAPGDSVPEINATIHPDGYVLPGPDEIEVGRYLFHGGIGTSVSPSTGQPERLSAASGADDAQIIPLMSGSGVVVVTDRRLLGLVNGESQLSDKVGLRSPGGLFFSMGYEDVDTISISQEKSMFGGPKERRVEAVGLKVGGFLGAEVVRQGTLKSNELAWYKVKTGRAYFDQVVQAAAAYRLGLAPTPADREQLQQVIAGHYTTDDGVLVANLSADAAAS